MDNIDWDKLIDEFNKYDTSPGMSQEDIEANKALHNLFKPSLVEINEYLVNNRTLTSRSLNAICTIIERNNLNILKAIGYNRHLPFKH